MSRPYCPGCNYKLEREEINLVFSGKIDKEKFMKELQRAKIRTKKKEDELLKVKLESGK